MVTVSNLFLYCFFGKLATESFEKSAECLYECNWQDLSVKLQKYLVLMIANSQKPLHYHGFGVAILNLQTFCGVGLVFLHKIRIFLVILHLFHFTDAQSNLYVLHDVQNIGKQINWKNESDVFLNPRRIYDV